jgi:predicted ATP-grasp superfamily ATP-dependent carboligase
MRKILLTNGDNLRTLMFFRAIADKKNLEVHISAETLFCACFFSRYCRHKLINANPKQNKKLFLKQMSDYCMENKIDVLIPMNADELEVILPNRKMFPKTLIPFPDYALFHRIKDKLEFHNAATKFKLPVPKTYEIRNTRQLEAKYDFPLIVKQRTGAGSKGVQKANNPEELKEVFSAIVEECHLSAGNYPILQEYIKGEVYCVSALCRDGQVLSISSYKSLRQLPIDHGTSTSRISVFEPRLTWMAAKFLKSLRWHGIAQMDAIKIGDKFYFLELNPRLYTSLNVTVKSGLNYPYYLCMLDKNIAIPKNYKTGVICRIIMADKLVFLASIFKKRTYPLGEFFNFRNTYFDDLDMKDPLPTIPLMVKFLRGKLL